MHGTTQSFERRVLSLLGAHDINDSEAAFQVTIQALAAISKVLGNLNLKTMISNKRLSPARSLRSLSTDDLRFLNKLVKEKRETLTENDVNDSQVRVQKLLCPPIRKKLAAYYTKTNGLMLMAELVNNFARRRGSPIALADPFLGSGLTITSTLRLLDLSDVRDVWGMESHPLPALIAFSAILYYLKGDLNKINIEVGDAFERIVRDLRSRSGSPGSWHGNGVSPRADVIVTNPPFTRWELLGSQYRSFLWNCVEDLGYRKYVTRKQLNLQVASLFLMDHLLDERGLLVSVLPASTFYTTYGEAARSMLREKYQINALIGNESDKSFSVDSGLKEVVLLATKQRPTSNSKTAFSTLQSEDITHIRQVAESVNAGFSEDNGAMFVDLEEKPTLWQTNWSVFFSDTRLRQTISDILSRAIKDGIVGTWDSIYGTQSIVRGVEMYGPDFFFVPNRYWHITDEDSLTVSISNLEDGSRLKLLKNYLIPALRKPSLYLDAIRPSVGHYLLSVPPEPIRDLQKDLARYINWGRQRTTGQPAIRLYGDFWYSHVNKQLKIKKPFGRVFLPDKVDPTFRNRGLFASHCETPLVASKNFHVVSLNDDSKERLLTLWFNSTLFISYFILTGRKITRSWSRMLEGSYFKMPIVNMDLLTKRDKEELEKAFRSVIQLKLPPLKHQLNASYRRSIDLSLLEAMGIKEQEETLRRVYSALEPSLG